jgi:hypothetical protein
MIAPDFAAISYIGGQKSNKTVVPRVVGPFALMESRMAHFSLAGLF